MVEWTESAVLDSVLGNVRMLEAVLELNVNLQDTEDASGQPQKLTGWLRLRYRE